MENNNKTNLHKNKVHRILAHSYSMYFIFFLIGVVLDLIFNLKIFNDSFMRPLGFVSLLFATILIFWAQNTSRNLSKENLSKESFHQGPYRFSRSPTHWGLFFLMIGFGMVTNALFVILTTLFSFLIAKYLFLNKQERILEEKYGEAYIEYKKNVKF